MQLSSQQHGLHVQQHQSLCMRNSNACSAVNNISAGHISLQLSHVMSADPCRSFSHVTGDVDVHIAISYFWLPGENDTSNAAFVQDQIDMLEPFVISTQVMRRSTAIALQAFVLYSVQKSFSFESMHNGLSSAVFEIHNVFLSSAQRVACVCSM